MYRTGSRNIYLIPKYALFSQFAARRLCTEYKPKRRINAFKVIVYATVITGTGIAGLLTYSRFDQEFRHKLEKQFPSAHAYLLEFGKFWESTDLRKMMSSVKEEIQTLKSRFFKASDSKQTEPMSADSPLVEEECTIEAVSKETKKETTAADEHAVYSRAEFVSRSSQIKEKVTHAVKEANRNMELALRDLDGYQKFLLELLKGNTSISEVDHSISSGFQNALKSLTNVTKLISDFEDELSKIRCDENYLIMKLKAFLANEKAKANSYVLKLKRVYDAEQILNHFNESVENARKKLKLEVESLLPTSESDPRILILFANRKIDELQEEIAKLKSLENVNIQRNVNLEFNKKIKMIKSALRAELMKEIKDDTDRRIEEELQSQAATLAKHYDNKMKKQKAEMQEMFDKHLEEMRLEEKNNLHKELAVTLARVQAIETALKNRAYMERRAQFAQEIWIAASHIDSVVGFNRLDLVNSAYQLSRKLPDKLAQTLLEDVIECAVTGHVENEKDLCNRFKHVYKISRKLVGVNESHCKLWHYIFSYLSSFLVRKSPIIDTIDKDSLINPKSLNDFELLDMAEKFVTKNDLLSAIKILNLVRSEAKNALRSWIFDALRYLQIKQSSSSLLAFATKSCLTVMPPETLPKS